MSNTTFTIETNEELKRAYYCIGEVTGVVKDHSHVPRTEGIYVVVYSFVMKRWEAGQFMKGWWIPKGEEDLPGPLRALILVAGITL